MAPSMAHPAVLPPRIPHDRGAVSIRAIEGKRRAKGPYAAPCPEFPVGHLRPLLLWPPAEPKARRCMNWRLPAVAYAPDLVSLLSQERTGVCLKKQPPQPDTAGGG